MTPPQYPPCRIKIKITNAFEAIYKLLPGIYPTFLPPRNFNCCKFDFPQAILYHSF